MNNKIRGVIAVALLYYLIALVMDNNEYMGTVLIWSGVTMFLIGIFEAFFDWRDERRANKPRKINKGEDTEIPWYLR